MSARPEFIPREAFRLWLKPQHLNRYVTIDGILASSWIARLEREGRPLRSKGKLFRLLDVVARAAATGEPIGQPFTVYAPKRISELQYEIETLTAAAQHAKHRLAVQEVCAELTGGAMLTEMEIVEGSRAVPLFSGVYFLIAAGRVQYVGQSVNVIGRLAEHTKTKNVEHFAFIPCDRRSLDALESLYIHVLRPPWNGNISGGEPRKHAPLRLDDLLGRRAGHMSITYATSKQG